MRDLWVTREHLLAASIQQGGQACIGPDRAWVDLTSGCPVGCASCVVQGSAGPVPVEPPQLSLAAAAELARRLSRAGTRQVRLGWRADPLHHSDLPAAIDRFLCEELAVEIRACMMALDARMLRLLFGLPLAGLTLRCPARVLCTLLPALRLHTCPRPRPPVRLVLLVYPGEEPLSFE